MYETGDAEAVYESGDKYIQITVLPKEGTTNIDTENAMIEDVYIKGCKGVYIQNSRFNAYVWADDEKQYTVLGNIERDEIKKVSEGLIIR